MGKIIKYSIGIALPNIPDENKRGPDTYALEISKRIANAPDFQCTIWSKSNQPIDFPHKKNIVWKKIQTKHLWTQVRLAYELTRPPKLEVIFIPSHVIPKISNGKFVTMIHDVAYAYFPKAYTSAERRYQKFALDTAIAKAAVILVPSLATKNDILKFTQCKADKICVIEHGVDKSFLEIKKKLSSANLGFGIKKPYILFTGRLEARKNIPLLIKAYTLLRQEERIKHQLVLVGKPGYGYQEIEKTLDNVPANFRKDIIETGFVNEKTYKIILSQADMFVMPSLYEGFGFSVLEAMAVGLPVIINQTPALMEVGGEAVISVPMNKPFPLAAKMSYIIHHPIYQLELSVKAQKRARRFSWEKSAEKTIATLIKVIKS